METVNLGHANLEKGKTSLKEIIDDILLLVRNSNISESEDLSRSHIAAWIDHYRRMLWKKHLDELKEQEKRGVDIEDLVDGEFLILKETLHHLVPVESKDPHGNTFTKRTETYTDEDGTEYPGELENIYSNKWTSILAVHDENGENIQYVNHIRRHYQYYRKYTFGEMTAYYMDDKHIYVQGLQDQNQLEWIYVLAVYEVPVDDANEEDVEDPDEDDVQIPTWMVPDIKKLIFNNELAFMINRPSDDTNNATLDGIKPHGPKEDEK